MTTHRQPSNRNRATHGHRPPAPRSLGRTAADGTGLMGTGVPANGTELYQSLGQQGGDRDSKGPRRVRELIERARSANGGV